MMEQDFLEGVRLFNSHQYFEAHEALEAVWIRAVGERKTFLHGLIQVAAAFHHRARSNPAGFQSLLEKGYGKLAAFGAEFDGVDLGKLLQQLEAWRGYLQSPSPPNRAAPPLPTIRLIDSAQHR
jgi:predicted metal-dependent hydrolase